MIWQYESTNFEAASSLSSLSLLAPEAPTQPQPPVPPSPRLTRRLPAIEEIDTVPSALLLTPAAPPVMPSAPSTSRALTVSTPRHAGAQESTLPALVPNRAPLPHESQDAASWTAGEASNSVYARVIAGDSPSDWGRHFAFNPLDRFRWWLLRPGRLEFILSLSGTLLLILVTCALLFALAFSFQGGASVTNAPARSASMLGKTAGKASGHAAAPPMKLAIITNGPYWPGCKIQVRGQGFSRNSRVSFTLDGEYTIRGENGIAALLPTGADGTFSGVLWLGIDPNWSFGHHTIVALDQVTGRHVAIPLVLVNISSTTSTTTPIAQATAGASKTPTSVPSVTVTTSPTPPGTPTNKTPVPSTPTVSPTVTPGKSPTPTTTVSPTATATKTAVPSGSGTQSSHVSLSNAITQSGDPPLGTSFSSTSPLVWVMATCYSLSMILLGVAGILYKRRPRPAKSI